MKCIQSVKSTKNVEVGTIKRVNDKDADSEVKSGYWKYIPKSEYKSNTRRPKTVDEQVKTSENTEGSKKGNNKKEKTKK